MRENDDVDVVVIGGGPAGLNAALVLSRSRRSVVVLDGGRPRNAPAAAMHGYLTRDGTAPLDLRAQGRTEVEAYGGRIVTGDVHAVARSGEGFEVRGTGGIHVRARRVLVASGVTDQLPDIPGLAQRWGKDVLHCPYCHGWEVRDQRIGVLATGPFATHQALLFAQLSDDVRVLQHTGPTPSDDDLDRLCTRDVAIVRGQVVGLEVDEDRLTGAWLSDGAFVALDALVIGPAVAANAAMLASVGLTPQPHPSGAGTYLPTDGAGRCEVPGIWAAGNVANPAANVIASAASGAMAGAQINADLIEDEIERMKESAA